jgi:hypothetical protein
MYDSYPERSLKFGISDAQTYHWLHSMNVLGRVNASLTANNPLAAAFRNNGEIIYVAHNYSSNAINVSYSDGYVLTVPAESMATSKDISINGILSASFPEAYPGGSVELSLSISGGTPSQVELVDGDNVIGQISQAPFTFQATNLGVGKHSFYARIYDGSNLAISNLVTVIVGEQLPYLGLPSNIPGTIEAGHFDIYEGGVGQGISYIDVSQNNEGDFRTSEYIDASMDFNEGAVVGWIASGEWMEYTIDVQQAGYYTLVFRYACGNQSGGGPFQLELDNEVVKSGISVSYTGNWDSWTSKTVTDIPMKGGKQILKVFFEHGELNLGEMTFTYSSPLSYDQPVANAGDNILVMLPGNTTALDGSNSSNPGSSTLNYSWEQIYGPSTLTFSSTQASQPTISTLVEGVYLIKLVVDNGIYQDEDEVYIISSYSNNVPPKVSIYSPADNAEFIEDDMIVISAIASDLIGYVVDVEFFVNGLSLGTASQFPFVVNWNPPIGQYSIVAKATDNDGSFTESQAVEVTVSEAPSCYGTSYDGEFDYEFSPDDNNPTITFIPSLPGMGNPTCILYYGTNTGLLPGYPVTPNVPYQISASEGTLIYFYYTYSYPGQGEHNNSAHMDSYEVGSCKLNSMPQSDNEFTVKFYPNPVSDNLNIEFPSGNNIVTVYNCSGKMISNFTVSNEYFNFNMRSFSRGVYIFRVVNNNDIATFRVIK